MPDPASICRLRIVPAANPNTGMGDSFLCKKILVGQFYMQKETCFFAVSFVARHTQTV